MFKHLRHKHFYRLRREINIKKTIVSLKEG